MSTIKGTSAADLVVKIGTRLQFTPGVGSTVIDVYSAQTLDAANAFFQSATGGNNRVDFDRSGPPYRIEVSAPDSQSGDPNDDYVDNWTMPAASADRSIFELDVFLALSEGVQLLIRQWDSGGKTQTDFDLARAAAAAVSSQELDDCNDILGHIIRGSEYFRTGQTSVRWTRTVGSNYSAANFAFANLLKIWTTSQLLALNPPTLIAALISNADTALETPEPGYLTGWLKQPIDVQQRGTDRFDITQEWTLNNWSTVLYFSAS